MGSSFGRKVRPPSQDRVMDAVLAGSRTLVAIAVRSLAAAGADVTLPQYRTLVILGYTGPQRTIDLAEELGVTSSTATRMVDRLVRRGLARRDVHPGDRRATRVEITADGRAVVAAVTERRRKDFATILRRMDREMRQHLVDGLEALNDAADESPEQNWSLGWGS